jgi:PKD repeat protein
MTLTLDVNPLLLPKATNPYYIIDFGDGNPVETPTYIDSLPATITHTYTSPGLYIVNTTVFNKISSVSKLILVQLDTYNFINMRGNNNRLLIY